MKTGIDKNESELEKMKRESLEWLETHGRNAPPFISIAVNAFKPLESQEQPEIKKEGWECPRCHAIHSYLKLSCDCPPAIKTSTTCIGTGINTPFFGNSGAEVPTGEQPIDLRKELPTKEDLAIELIARFSIKTSRGTSIARNAFIDCYNWILSRPDSKPITDDLQKIMNDIKEWSDRQFGEEQRNPAIIYHLKKEVDELIQCFDNGIVTRQENDNLLMEFADCFMLLLDSATHAFFTEENLLKAIKDKLEINKNRTWGNPDENGVVEHV